MKRAGWIMSLVICWGLWSCTAEANVGDALKNVWSYLFAPVNCVGNLARDIAADTVKAVWCVIGNANHNPVTGDVIIHTDDSHQL